MFLIYDPAHTDAYYKEHLETHCRRCVAIRSASVEMMPCYGCFRMFVNVVSPFVVPFRRDQSRVESQTKKKRVGCIYWSTVFVCIKCRDQCVFIHYRSHTHCVAREIKPFHRHPVLFLFEHGQYLCAYVLFCHVYWRLCGIQTHHVRWFANIRT